MKGVRFALTCGTLGLALASGGCDRTRPGRRAPALELTDLRGAKVSLAALRGRVVLVGFFATWAPPCRLAMLTWARHQRTWGRRGLTVVGVALDEERAVLERVLKASPAGFTVAPGDDPAVRDWLGTADRVLPSAFLVGADGRIRARYEGVQPGDLMTADIERAIAGMPAPATREDR